MIAKATRRLRMKKGLTYIAFLTMALLAYPTLYKAYHSVSVHHHGESRLSEPGAGYALSEETDQCHVCDFEYASFIQGYRFFLPGVAHFTIDRASSYYNPVYTSYAGGIVALRGPPFNQF